MLLREQLMAEVRLCVINEVVAVVGMHLGAQSLACGIGSHGAGGIIGHACCALDIGACRKVLQEGTGSDVMHIGILSFLFFGWWLLFFWGAVPFRLFPCFPAPCFHPILRPALFSLRH